MKKLLLLCLAMASCVFTFGQVAITPTIAPPDPSAMLDVVSTTKGLLTPRMTTAQRTAIASPANGLFVYDITTLSLWIFKSGTGWVEIVSMNLPFSASVNSPDTAFKITNTNAAGGNAAAFKIDNPTNNGSALTATSNGAAASRAIVATHTGAGTAAEFSLADTNNSSSALLATTVGDGYTATFVNSKNNATNSGAIHAVTSASSGVGYPNAIFAQADGTLGTAALFNSSNSGSVRPTVLVLNSGLERSLIVSADNAAYPATAMTVRVGSGGTSDSRVASITQEGIGGGLDVVAGNVLNQSDALNVGHSGTGIAVHASNSNTNGNGSAGVFSKTASAAAYTTDPVADLEVRHPSVNAAGTAGLRLFNTGGNEQSWTFYANNTTGALSLYYKNTLVGSFSTTGAYTVASDARLKTNIVQMPAVLNRLMQLQPKVYNYTFDREKRQTAGFLAQQVEPLFPSIVYKNTSDDNSGYYKMDYAAFGVIAVKAVQEQQKMLQAQRHEIRRLKKEIEAIKAMMKHK